LIIILNSKLFYLSPILKEKNINKTVNDINRIDYVDKYLSTKSYFNELDLFKYYWNSQNHWLIVRKHDTQ